jgi:V-type H+-transporting ATPase subunit H
MYATICCLWYISFDEENVHLFERGDLELVPNVITELQKAEKEKILRVALALLKNLCNSSEKAVEIMVEYKLLREVDAIAKRVLKDEDVKQYLEDVSVIMENSIKLLSSFEKYMVEIENGKLVPGVTHTESFWKENVRNFEDNRFEVIGKIAALLDSDDEQCQLLACYDLGEFARMHPFGKSILE